MIISGHEFGHVFVEGVVQDACADFVTNTNNEALVVDAGESFAGDFVDLV